MIYLLYEDKGPVLPCPQDPRIMGGRRYMIRCKAEDVPFLEEHLVRMRQVRASAKLTYLVDDEDDGAIVDWSFRA
jgi:hypothetical protein